VLRVLFNSDFFKNARYQHMKSPAEVVVGTLRLVGGHELPRPGYGELSMNTAYMVRICSTHPPSRVAHRQGVDQQRLPDGPGQLRRGKGWRYVAAGRSRHHRPAEGSWHVEPRSAGRRLSRPAGPVEVGSDTKQELTAQAKEWGQISWDSDSNAQIADQHSAEMMQLIAATREYQFG